jgi:hypothetical protein
MKRLILIVSLLCAIPASAQSWSNIISSSRAINWTGAGLPPTLPDGETTTNPWTPPTRTQCVTSACNTVSGGTVTATSLGAALVSCPAGTYILIPAGTFTINNANIPLYVANGGNVAAETTGSGGCTLKGSGPQSTTIELTGSAEIQAGISWNGATCTWSSGLSEGSTSLTATGCNWQPVVGTVATLGQCDSGYSGAFPCTGTAPVDNGALFVCGDNLTNITSTSNPCQYGTTEGTGPNHHQEQNVYVTGVTGTCSSSCTITFTPGIYMPNWASGQSPVVTWITSSSAGNTITAEGIGLEDMTVYLPTGNTAPFGVAFGPAYASWVKGVRFVGAADGNTSNPLTVGPCKNCLVLNNYFFPNLALVSGIPAAALSVDQSSDTLVLNNAMTTGVPWTGQATPDGNVGNVFAYNMGRDAFTQYYENRFFEHHAYTSFNLREADQIAGTIEDATWATHGLETNFRNYWSGWDPPYASPNLNNARAAQDDEYSRFINYVGNVFGSSLLTIYQGQSGVGEIYTMNAQNHDSLVVPTSFRWMNYDSVTGGTRSCGNSSSPNWSAYCGGTSEVPTSLSGNAVPFENSIPSTTSLPCSFFLSGYTSTTCTAHPTGGTGLNWWKVCKTWTTFPTSCAATQTQPFPAVGPDVTGGSYLSGHAYDVPAAVAWEYLPTDTTYQNSYTISSSTWSSVSGTCSPAPAPCEILTFSGGVLPNLMSLLGAFEFSGVNSACVPPTFSSLSSNPNSEMLITASTATTVTYALPTNPGVSCTGTMKFPDVRQFDERVFENDPLGVILSPPTENFGTVNLGSSSSPITFTLTNNTGTTATSISPTVTGGNSGDFAITNSGTGSCAAASGSIAGGASCTFTVNFTPGAAGSRSTTLSVSYSGGDGASPQTSALSGTGNATGSVSLSPSSQNFGTITVGASSATVSFTLSNTTASSVTSITVTNTGGNTADFVNTNTGSCTSTLAASSSCTIIMKFSPSAVGSRSTTLNVADSASSSPQQSSLSGTGITSVTAPAAAIMAILKLDPVLGENPIPLLITASLRLSISD